MVRELRSVNEANGLVLSQLLLFANLFFFFQLPHSETNSDQLARRCSFKAVILASAYRSMCVSKQVQVLSLSLRSSHLN